MRKRVFSILAAGIFLAGLVPAAWAALADVGIPIAPHGYPAWYEDGTGLKLELCVPPPAGNATRPDLCIGDPLELDGDGNPINPLVITGESFWWLGETSMVMPGGGDAELTLAIEGTFGGAEAPIDGQQISFGRTRIRIDTPVAGTYTVTHPYQTQVFEVVDPAEGINYTADIGAANFLFPAVGFRGTLSAPIGPYLTWPDYETNESLQVLELDPDTGEPTGVILEQYVGNPNVASTVVGGPNGNIFRVQGPGGIDVQTDQFFVMGKVFDPTKALVPYEYANYPEQKLLDLGSVNRVTPFADPSLGEVTGVDYDYAVGYPIWYQENLGTALEPVAGVQLTLCTPGDAMCISDPIDPTNTTQTTLRTGGEGFWWSADARFDVPAGRAALVLGLEATFGGAEALIDGQQIAFGRVRIRVDTAQAGTYRVTHPYGQIVFEDVPVDDSGINYTADIGIADPSDPDFAFVGAMYSDIGPTFLKWDTFDPNPANSDPLLRTPSAAGEGLFNYYVGNPGVEHTIVGSPFGTNYFRVEILDGSDWRVIGETDQFAVSGKIYDPATFEFAIDPAAPVATNDAATLDLAAASEVTVNVLGNDVFADGAPVTVSVLPVGEAFGPENGTAVANNPAGTVTYTPSADFAQTGGVDTFAYNIVDGSGLTSNTAIVTITVIPIETITIDRARLNNRNLRLDLRGTSNFPGTSLTIHAGAADGPVVGSVVVGDNGRWSFRGTATANLTSVTLVSSSNSGTTVTQALQVR